MGKPAARLTDMHVCPMVTGLVPHVGGPVAGPGVPTVLVGGIPAAVVGDMCVCVGPPDSIVMGSTGVFIGGKPAARMGDQTAHGGVIVAGCPTVLIGDMGAANINAPAIQDFLISLPPALQNKAAQIVAMKEAALNGTPFCEKCAKAANKS